MNKLTTLATSDIAALLREYGQRTALQGGNPYRAKAYHTAAENLSALTEPLEEVIARQGLTSIPGIGDAIADIIQKLHQSGFHPKLEEMRKDIPAGVLEILNIPGLRSEQALKIYKEAGIADIETLETALRSGKLNDIKGFTAAFQNKILQGIEIKRQTVGRMHIHRAGELLESARTNLLRTHPELEQVTLAGEFRRKCELVKNLTLVATANKVKSIKIENIKVEIATADNYGAALLFATGSAEHLKELKDLAKSKGMTLSPAGLKKGRNVVAAAAETEIYKALGLAYIEPELREGRGEIKLAAQKKLPKLVTLKDIHGILHSHTNNSDGADTLEDMADVVREDGYEYFGLTDHSQSAHYAGGLLPDEIIAQHKEVDRLNKIYGAAFHIFKGIESDIRSDGSLDCTENVLKRFDFIVASVHSQFKMSKDEQTARIIRAVENPYTTILGHMTGRQLLRRPGYELDIEKVLSACAKNGVAVEINANPWRLDLDWRWHGRALDLGCMMSINPDAHSTGEIDLMEWGIAMARKGGVPPTRILNCMNLKDFKAFLKKRKQRRS